MYRDASLFGRVVGLYIATLFVVWQVINVIAFRSFPAMPILVGGALDGPSGSRRSRIGKLVPLLAPGDIVIDGGNSYYHDDIRRGFELKSRGIHYIDVGTSGGVMGIERGYCLMIGGENEIVEHLRPIFAALAPGVARESDATEGEGSQSTAEQGYLHCGPQGAGHWRRQLMRVCQHL